MNSFTLISLLALLDLCLGQMWSLTDSGDYDSLIPESFQPQITTLGQKFEVNGGDNVKLPCEIDREGDYNVLWKRRDSIIWIYQKHSAGYYIQHVLKDPRIRSLNTSLIITNVSASDEGYYVCELSHTQFMVQHQLIVYVAPNVRPTGGVNLREEKQGSKVVLSCDVEGNPKPFIHWYKKGSEEIIGENTSTLVIKKLDSSDEGIYKCKVSNDRGDTDEAFIALHAQYAPRVTPQEKPTHTAIDESATLHCRVDARPTARVFWLRKGYEVDGNRLQKGIATNNEYTLKFPRVIFEDLGYYSCYAMNRWGNHSGIVHLTGTPAAPVIISLPVSYEEEQYLLRWETLSYSPIIEYEVQLKNSTEDDTEWINVTIPGLKTSSMYHSQKFSMGTLSPHSQIDIRIRAQNEIGLSPWSSNFTLTQYTSDELIEAASILNISKSEASSVNLENLEEELEKLDLDLEQIESTLQQLDRNNGAALQKQLTTESLFFLIFSLRMYVW